MILERSSSVMRGLRPAPGRSTRPSIPSTLKRWPRVRTVLGWHPSSSAILVVRSPRQLREIIRALVIQSPGAWRLPASLRIFRSSSLSWGARAQHRTERLAQLERDRDTLLESYAGAMPEAIDALGPEERHQVYRMIGMEVHLAPDGSFDLSGDVISFSKLGLSSS
jgi:hypothetical protein